MNSLNKFLLLAALLFYTTKLSAQEAVNKGDMIIHINTTNAMSFGSNFMHLYKRGKKVEIIYAKFDSIRYAAVRKDTAYINATKDPHYLEPVQAGRLGRIFDRYRVYDTIRSVINLKRDTAYRKILLLLTQTSKEELEKSKIANRYYLDGFGFSCTVITDIDTKDIYVRTPMPDTHPIVSALLTESYNRVFRKK
jgi:hypothetical protein